MMKKPRLGRYPMGPTKITYLLPLKYFRYETEQRGERARSATKYSSARDYYDSRRRSAEREPVVCLLINTQE